MADAGPGTSGRASDARFGYPTRRWIRGIRAVATTLVLGASVVVVRQAGVVQGWVALIAALLAVLAVPTSRSLSRRILLAGCVFFGWVPLLWWFPLPVGSVGRVTVLLAATVALTGAWVSAGERPRDRLRRLVPRWRGVDVLPPLAAAGAAALLAPWLSVRDGASALTLMLTGWDNAPHANMVMMIRAHGQTITSLPVAPDGSAWEYSNYPQGFHASAATLIELMASPSIGSPAQEAARFLVATATINVAIVAMLAAGISSLPAVRRRFFVALPATLLIFALVLLGPGAASLSHGFTNFTLASALVGAVGLVAVSMPRVAMPLQMAAVGGAMVGVAHNWAPLLLLAVPLAAASALPFQRRRWSASRLHWMSTLAVLSATAAGVLAAFHTLNAIDAGAIATRGGAIEEPSLGLTLALAFAAMAASLAALRLRRTDAGHAAVVSGVGVRIGSWTLVPVIGLGLMTLLAARAASAGLPPAYYFWKVTTAVELVVGVLLAASLAVLVARLIPAAQGRLGRGAAVASSLMLGLGATQLFGYAGVWSSPASDAMQAPGAGLYATARDKLAHPTVAATDLLAATSVQFQHPGTRVVFLAVGPSDVSRPDLGFMWFKALTRTWSAGAPDIPHGSAPIHGAASAARSATAILASHPDVLVAIRPDLLDQVRAQVANKVLAPRVVTW